MAQHEAADFLSRRLDLAFEDFGARQVRGREVLVFGELLSAAHLVRHGQVALVEAPLDDGAEHLDIIAHTVYLSFALRYVPSNDPLTGASSRDVAPPSISRSATTEPAALASGASTCWADDANLALPRCSDALPRMLLAGVLRHLPNQTLPGLRPGPSDLQRPVARHAPFSEHTSRRSRPFAVAKSSRFFRSFSQKDEPDV
jgi:hypothetical protein